MWSKDMQISTSSCLSATYAGIQSSERFQMMEGSDKEFMCAPIENMTPVFSLPILPTWSMHFDNDEHLLQVEMEELSEDDLSREEKHMNEMKQQRTLNNSELLKVDEQQEDVEKEMSAFGSLSASSSLLSSLVDVREVSGVLEGVDRESACVCFEKRHPSSDSYPAKSALRGGYEELGLGPRPKLRVKWAPTVWDPPCTSISHTVKCGNSKRVSKRRLKAKLQQEKKKKKRRHNRASLKLSEAITKAMKGAVDSEFAGQLGIFQNEEVAGSLLLDESHFLLKQ